jgi:hypothetical protein
VVSVVWAELDFLRVSSYPFVLLGGEGCLEEKATPSHYNQARVKKLEALPIAVTLGKLGYTS